MKDANAMEAEIAERDRILEQPECQIDREVAAHGVEPARLFGALEAVLGCGAGALTATSPPVAPPAPQPAKVAEPTAAVEADVPQFEVSGRIKFFDSLKRFGFIVPDDGRGDVLIHVSCLRAAGHATAN